MKTTKLLFVSYCTTIAEVVLLSCQQMWENSTVVQWRFVGGLLVIERYSEPFIQCAQVEAGYKVGVGEGTLF